MNKRTFGNRIWIVGPPGSGKTTLADQIEHDLDIPHYELDALFWQADWEKTEKQQFLDAVDHLAKKDKWVVDGQYTSVHNILAEYADTIIWLDFQRRNTFPRLVKRTFKRLVTRQKLWNGNREKVTNALQFFAYAFHIYPKVIRHNEELFHTLDQKSSVQCLRVRKPDCLKQIVEEMKSQSAHLEEKM
ncbi:AAA family ATPase [Bacillus sp. NPDC077027]|uniref:AAA family ATPase n=1 Tax=Bacillus sp. NPDC077027 TaxID=3390548 RepID=UPI003D074C20